MSKFSDLMMQLGRAEQPGEVVPEMIPIVREAGPKAGFSFNPMNAEPGVAHPGLPEIVRSALRGMGEADTAGKEGIPLGQTASPDLTNLVIGLGGGGGALAGPEAEAGKTIHGVFAGLGSKTANWDKLSDAAKIAGKDKGVTSATDVLKMNPGIHEETGWFYGPDGMPRYEIPDPKGKLNLPWSRYPDEMLPQQEKTVKQLANPKGWGGEPHPGQQGIDYLKKYTLKDVLPESAHPELYAAYPQLLDRPVGGTGFNFGLKGAYDENLGAFYLAHGQPDDIYSTLMHEIQHAIQGYEGFSKGGNTARFTPPELTAKKKELEAAHQPIEQHIRDNNLNEYTVRRVAKDLAAGKPADVEYYNRTKPELVSYIQQNPDMVSGINKMLDQKDQLTHIDDQIYAYYKALGGEAEARHVQDRIGQSNIRPPLEKMDVPPEKQIFQFGDKYLDIHGNEVKPQEHLTTLLESLK